MKKLLLAAAIASASLVGPASAAVSVSVGEPGFYGRVDIGGYQPQVIYRQPMVIEREARYRTPVYLHVPTYQARHWGRYCSAYDACGEPVYFVQDDWYNQVYVPSYRERHPVRYNEYHEGRGDRDSYYRDDRRYDRRDERRDERDHHREDH